MAFCPTWLLLTFISGRLFVAQPLGFVVLSVFVFSVPVAYPVAGSAVNQIGTLSYYKEGGRAHKFLAQRLFRALIWVITALATTFLMLLQFATYTAINLGNPSDRGPFVLGVPHYDIQVLGQ